MQGTTTTPKPKKPKRVTPYCGSCLRGENKVEASCEVRGTILRYDGRTVPYHANLCDDHYTMMTDDGAVLRTVQVYEDTDAYNATVEYHAARDAFKGAA